ncbi:MAG: UDP-N-acetylmuramoyl-L-alanyl-D-glutamate--2,6-diaminopimelate ligase [Verrucomicrobiales bacterium]
MKVSELLHELRDVTASGPLEAEVLRVACDSRRIDRGALYCALKGEKSDGLDFVDDAIKNGAAGILCECAPRRVEIAWLSAENARRSMAEASAIVYGHPSHALRMVGVTGTNGKTTTAFLIHHLMKAAHHRAGLIGTVKYDDGLEEGKARHTTPESPDLNEWLARMRNNGCFGAAMEVSSHALAQWRTHAVEFDAAVFTNLTQDHLDFHQTMEEYFLAKVKLFEQVARQASPKRPVAVLNSDDPFGRRLASRLEGRLKVVRYGFGATPEFRASNVKFDFHGTSYHLEVGTRTLLVRLPLIGRFNVYNSLAALAAATECGLNLREAVAHLAQSPQVPGRLESVAERRNFRVFVDYAHTPDALQNALATLRELHPKRMIAVFGCGGDRDRDKRPLMGAVADQLCDHTILTSDNPRSEDPASILGQIRQGFRGSQVETIEDRKQAIGKAVELAGEGDIVLIAGKGHEDYQIFRAETIDFDDRKVARHFIQQKESSPLPTR